jgi:hypothetical protein
MANLRVAVTDPVGVMLHRMGLAPTRATVELARLVTRQQEEMAKPKEARDGRLSPEGWP